MGRWYRAIMIGLLIAALGPISSARGAGTTAPAWHILAGAGVPSFANAVDVAVGPGDNVYVADAWFHQITEVSPQGVMLNRWPMPSRGGTSALEVNPAGLAVDSSGDMYVRSGINSWDVLKFTAQGTRDPSWTPRSVPNNFAGGVATDTAGNVYVTCNLNACGGTLYKLSPAGGVLAHWTLKDGSHNAEPAGVAVAPDGSIYVADVGGNEILKLSPSGSVFAPWGQPGMVQGPLDVTTDPEGHVFVLDSQAAGKIQEFSSSGALLEAWNIPSVHQYAGIAADSTGRVYLADGRHVQVYSTAGKLLSRWGGGGTAPGQLAAPAGIAAGPQGNVFVADTGNNRVQKFSTNGRVIAVWSRPFRRPAGIAVDGGGNILVADTGNNRLLELSPAGHIVAAWTTAGGVPFSAPRGVAVGRNETIYLADTGNHRILRLAPQAATFVTLFPTGPWVKPVSLAVDREGRVYVGEMQDVTHATGAVLVQALTPAGKPIPSWRPSRGPLWYSQTGVAVDARGDVFATDSDSYRAGNFGVWEYSRTGRLLRRWGPAGNGPGEFDFPQAVSSGPGGTVFAADTGNNRVQVLRPGS